VSSLLGSQQPDYYYPLLYRLTGTFRFREGQKAAVDAVLAGKDLLFVAPTGSGKSLIFQLPALLAPKPSLIITPLRALMEDQVRKLWERGVPATFINSDLSKEEREERLKFFLNGAFKLLYLAPERLNPQKAQAHELAMLEKVAMSYIVVDEAHTIEEWGWAFRPSYRRLGEMRRKLGNPQAIAVTATATPDVREEIANELGIEPQNELLQGFDRPNIIFHVKRLNEAPAVEGNANLHQEKARYLIALLKKIGLQSRVIVYVPTVKIGSQLLALLKKNKMDVDFFHAERSNVAKENIQARFGGLSQPRLNLLIATSAFGMGIDIPDIRFVIHWTHPATLNSYFQQAGRAGRDQKPAMAIILKSPGDEGILKWMLQMNLENAQLSETEKAQRQKVELDELERVVKFAEDEGCLRAHMFDYFRAKWTQPKTKLLQRIFNALTGRSYLSYRHCCRKCDSLFDSERMARAIEYIT
jgi:RecQ family ATP-dependent DNA helicase